MSRIKKVIIDISSEDDYDFECMLNCIAGLISVAYCLIENGCMLAGLKILTTYTVPKNIGKF